MKRTITLTLFALLNILATAQVWDWATASGSSTGQDATEHSVKDKDGNVYIVGSASKDAKYGHLESKQYGLFTKYIAKLSPEGDFIWVKSFSSPQNIFVIGVDVDTLGNVFIAGNFFNYIKYSEEDSLVWNKYIYNHYEDYYYDYYYYDIYESSAFVAKFTENGETTWFKNPGKAKCGEYYYYEEEEWIEEKAMMVYEPYYESDMIIRGFEVLDDGSWYISGSGYGNIDFGEVQLEEEHDYCYYQSYITKFDSNDEAIWAKRINDEGRWYYHHSQARDVIEERNDKLYLFVWQDYYQSSLHQYDLDGNLVKESELLINRDYYFNESYQYTVDSKGGVIMAFYLYDWQGIPFNGNLYSSNGLEDALVVKYTPELEVEWIKQIGGSFSDIVTDIGVDNDDNIYISGQFQNRLDIDNIKLESSGEDIFVAKFSNEGEVHWAKKIGSGSGDQSKSITLNEDGTLLLCGSFSSISDFPPFQIESSGFSDGFIAKLGCRPAQPEKLFGDTIVCLTEETYYVNKQPHVDYRWSITEGGFITTDDTLMKVNWTDTGTYTIKVTPIGLCGDGEALSQTVIVKDIPQNLTLEGKVDACIGTESYTITEQPETEYSWTIEGGGSVLPIEHNAVMNWFETGDYTLSVTATNFCGDSEPVILNINVKDIPETPTDIAGEPNVCLGTYSYMLDPDDDLRYTWNLNGGGQVTQFENNANIQWDTKGVYKVSVYTHNRCGSSEKAEKQVTVNSIPSKPSIIEGNKAVCLGTESYGVSYTEGITYHWDISSGGIVQANENTANIIWAETGNHVITVKPENECGFGQTQSSAIVASKKPEQPDTIYGLYEVCAGMQQYSIAPQADVSYTWNLSGGGVITQNGYSASIDWEDAGVYTLSVIPQNSCGIGEAKVITIKVNASVSQYDHITGDDKVCLSTEAYSVPEITGVAYTWELDNGGVLTTDNNTASIEWTDKGFYTLLVHSSDGCSKALNIAVNDVPDWAGEMSGDTMVCAGEIFYSVRSLNNVNYNWEVSENVDMYAVDNAASVNWKTAGTYNLSVTPYNECGDGQQSSRSVLVQVVPENPSSIDGETLACINESYEYSVEETVGYSYVWSNYGDAIMISEGAKAQTVFLQDKDYVLQVYATNSCGSSPVTTIEVEALAKPQSPRIFGDSIVCIGLSQYHILKEPHISTVWMNPEGGSIITSGDTVIVTWEAVGPQFLQAIRTNKCGQSDTTTMEVLVKAIPAQPTLEDGNTEVCVGITSYSVTPQPEVLFDWDVLSGGSASAVAHSASVIWNKTGAHTIRIGAYNMCGRSENLEIDVNVESVPNQPSKIIGDAIVCHGEQVYSITEESGVDYQWIVDPETGYTTSHDTCIVNWDSSGFHTISVEAYNKCGNSPTQSQSISVIDIPEAIPSITGDDTVCLGEVVFTAVNDNKVDLVWHTQSNVSQLSQSTDGTRVQFTETGTSIIKVQPQNMCGLGTITSKEVFIKTVPQQTLTITGENDICKSSQVYSIQQEDDVYYIWSVNGGGNLYPNEDTASIDWHTSGEYTLTVQQFNMCGFGTSGQQSVTVTTVPNSTSFINGSSQVCIGADETFTIHASPNENYQWWVNGEDVSLPHSDTVIYKFENEGIQLISVNSFNKCGSGPSQTKQVFVTSKPQKPVLIHGAEETCYGSNEQYSLFSYANITNNWTIPNGNNLQTIDNNTVSIEWLTSGTNTLSVTANNTCGESSPLSFDVTVLDQMQNLGSVNGKDTVCLENSIYTITKNPHYTYTWQLNGGGSMSANDTSANVSWNTPGKYKLTVIYKNQCGAESSSETTVLVEDIPAPIGHIYGDDKFCMGYRSFAHVGTQENTIHWSLPNGGILTPSNDSVYIEWTRNGIFTLEAYLSNHCGNSIPTRKTYTILKNAPEIGDEIFSDDTVCISHSFEAWVPFDEDYKYTWKASGASHFENLHNGFTSEWYNPGQYSITVFPYNACGNGNTLQKNILVETDTRRPEIILKNDTLYSPHAYGNQWYLNGEIQENLTDNYILPTVSGDYSLSVENTCGRSLVSEGLLYIVEESKLDKVIKTYPNPVVDKVEIRMPANKAVKHMYIFDNSGKLYAKYTIEGETKKTIDMSGMPGGEYFFHFKTNDHVATKRIIKRSDTK